MGMGRTGTLCVPCVLLDVACNVVVLEAIDMVMYGDCEY